MPTSKLVKRLIVTLLAVGRVSVSRIQLSGCVIALSLGWICSAYAEDKIAEKHPLTREKSSLRQIGMLLRLYGEQHSGNFPAWLGALVIADLGGGTPQSIAPLLKFHDPETGFEYDWLYFQGYALTSPKESIIAAAPRAISRERRKIPNIRLVLYVTGDVEYLDESTYQPSLQRQFLTSAHE